MSCFSGRLGYLHYALLTIASSTAIPFPGGFPDDALVNTIPRHYAIAARMEPRRWDTLLYDLISAVAAIRRGRPLIRANNDPLRRQM